MYTKTCIHCGSRFETTSSKVMYCQPQCTVREKLAPFAGLDGCWVWPGTKRPHEPYGYFLRERKRYWAHRVSYETFSGPIPEGHIICHTCDNPPCCNPAHLFAGTKLDNARDRDAKGRNIDPIGKIGVEHHEARLTPEAVRYIRRMAAAGASFRSLGRQHGITHEAIRKVVHRQTWAHVS